MKQIIIDILWTKINFYRIDKFIIITYFLELDCFWYFQIIYYRDGILFSCLLVTNCCQDQHYSWPIALFINMVHSFFFHNICSPLWTTLFIIYLLVFSFDDVEISVSKAGRSNSSYYKIFVQYVVLLILCDLECFLI